MPSTLLLGRTDIGELLTVDDCLAAVESAFCAHVAGRTLPPAILGVPVADGGFHVKAAGFVISHPYFAARTNANFPGNPLPAALGRGSGVLIAPAAQRAAARAWLSRECR